MELHVWEKQDIHQDEGENTVGEQKYVGERLEYEGVKGCEQL